MGQLSFLKGNVAEEKNIKYVASERFFNEHGAPEAWEIKCITSAEDEKLRESCTNRVPMPGKRGQFTPELDANLYLGKLAVACTVFPNLNDAELQDSYGVMGADNVLKAMLYPGEYAAYLEEIQRVNKFDITLQDKVDAAKN